MYFWRTYDGQEIALIEEIDNKLKAFEIKWSSKKKVKIPKKWYEKYKNSQFHININ